MKLSYIFESVINEDFKTQQRRFISQGIEPDIVNSYIEKFKHIKDKKYREMFDTGLDIAVTPDKRNNIDAYTDFHDLERMVDYVGGKRPITTSMSTNNSDNIEVSGEAIYKDENIELYYADTPRACIKYKGKFPYSWCVARSDSSNMFYTYRFKPYEPAFYFVKDIQASEKEFGIWNMTKNVFKGSFKNPYHFFVIQVPKNAKADDIETKQYIVTSANNDGDKQMSWQELIKRNPKLAPIHNLLEPKPFTPEERSKNEKFKNGISDDDFKRLSYEDKRSYLDIYPTIARPITYRQLIELPDDLLNLYVSFGIGLDDQQFAFIKNKPDILKRYTQISKRKLDEYLARTDAWERRRLKMAFTELIILSDEDITNYLKTLSNKDINQFINDYGEDKFDFLEKHLSDKFGAAHLSNKALLLKANSGDDDALRKLYEMIPEGIILSFNNDYIQIDTRTYGNRYIEDKIGDSVNSFYTALNYRRWDSGYGYNNYFDGWEDGLDTEYESYIEGIIKDNLELGNKVKAIGFSWDIDTVKDLLNTYNKKDLIHQEIIEEFSDANLEAKEDKWTEMRDKIRSIITFDDDDIDVKLGAFIMYINDKEFFTTDRDNFAENLVDLLTELLEDYDVPSNMDSIYEEIDNNGGNNMVIDNAKIIRFIESAIEESIQFEDENVGDYTGDEESENKVAKLKSQVVRYLNDTLSGLNQDPMGHKIDNSLVTIEFNRSKFKLDGQIYAKLTSKKTGEKQEGFIYIKDIPAYFTNYKLYEEIMRIKLLLK